MNLSIAKIRLEQAELSGEIGFLESICNSGRKLSDDEKIRYKEKLFQVKNKILKLDKKLAKLKMAH